MCYAKAKWIPWLLMTIANHSLLGGNIVGSVKNPLSQPVPGMAVVLLDGAGQRTTTTTDTKGAFKFTNLPSGDYEVSLVTKPKQLVLSPPCAKFDFNLGGNETAVANFTVVVTGVSVDFGRPTGGINLEPSLEPSTSFQLGEPFSMAVRIWNMNVVSEVPDVMVLSGKFHTPSPDVMVIVDSVSLGLSYAPETSEASFIQTSSGQLQLQIEAQSFPHLAIDGDAIILRGRVISPGGGWLGSRGGRMCFCVNDLEFYRNGHLVISPHFYQLTRPWAGCVEVETGFGPPGR